MATKHQVQTAIYNVYTALIAAEAAHPDSPELATLHEKLGAADALAVEHFGLERPQARSGGGSKTPPPPPPPPGGGEDDDTNS